GQMADLIIQTAQWCQNLVWRPDDPAMACAALAAETLDEMRQLQEIHGSPAHVLMTAAASRLPGVLPMLKDALWQPVPEEPADVEPNSDFGEGLMQEGSHESAPLTVLPSDAMALAVHGLAERIAREQMQRGFLDTVPLPTVASGDAG